MCAESSTGTKKNKNKETQTEMNRNVQKQTNQKKQTETYRNGQKWTGEGTDRKIYQYLKSYVSYFPMAKKKHNVYVKSYCGRVRDATFDFLEFQIFLKNAACQRSLAFQMNVLERLEKVNLTNNN